MRFWRGISFLLYSGCWPIIPGTWEEYQTNITPPEESRIIGYVVSDASNTAGLWGRLASPSKDYDSLDVIFGIHEGCTRTGSDAFDNFLADTMTPDGSASSLTIDGKEFELHRIDTLWYNSADFETSSGQVELSYNGSEPVPEQLGLLPTNDISLEATDTEFIFQWSTDPDIDRVVTYISFYDEAEQLLEASICVSLASNEGITVEYSEFKSWESAYYLSVYGFTENQVTVMIPDTNEAARFSLLKAKSIPWD